MKYFIAYRHTGEDPARLRTLLVPIRQAFEQRGDEIYCTFFNDTSFRARRLGPHEIMYEAFQKIEEMGHLFAALDSVDKSEGMLMEIGYCIAKNSHHHCLQSSHHRQLRPTHGQLDHRLL
jgi:hypothetical protein